MGILRAGGALFWLAITAISLRLYTLEVAMIDRIIGICGLALAILGLITQYRWPKVPRWMTDAGLAIGCILIGVVVSPVLVIRTESEKQPQAAALSTPLKPEIRFTVPGGAIFTPDALDWRNEYTGIVLDIHAWNTGQPSIVTEWSLVVIPTGKIPMIAQNTIMPEMMRAAGPTNSMVIKGAESFIDHTKATPIGSVPVDGKLLFYVKLRGEIVKDADTIFELSLRDAYGTESIRRQRIGDWLAR